MLVSQSVVDPAPGFLDFRPRWIACECDEQTCRPFTWTYFMASCPLMHITRSTSVGCRENDQLSCIPCISIIVDGLLKMNVLFSSQFCFFLTQEWKLSDSILPYMSTMKMFNGCLQRGRWLKLCDGKHRSLEQIPSLLFGFQFLD